MKNESDSLKLIRLCAQIEAMRRDLRRTQDVCGFLVAFLLLLIMVICSAIWADVWFGDILV